MINLAVNGCNGKMGKQVIKHALEDKNFTLSAGIDYKARPLRINNREIPVFDSLEEYKMNLDVVIDFSDAMGIYALLKFAKSKEVPIVIATSGLKDEHFELMKDCAKTIPVFQASNMSVGIYLLKKAIKQLAVDAGDVFDIEIVEKYHRLKKDSPSGTALSLAGAMSEVLNWTPEFIYGRHEKDKLRSKNEIGIHSVRGGSIIGEYDIIFAAQDEVLQFSHKAYSSSIFALGSLDAAAFIVKQKPGLYHMDDLFQ